MSVTDQVVAETRCTRADTNMESRRHTNTADTHTHTHTISKKGKVYKDRHNCYLLEIS